MERTTRKHLEARVRMLANIGIIVTLDHHQPGGNRRTWKVETNGGSRTLTHRMTADECFTFLEGMLYGTEMYKANPTCSNSLSV